MKKIIALLLALVMILPLALASCDDGSSGPKLPAGTGDKQTEDNKTPDTDKKPEKPEGPYEYKPTEGALYSGAVGIGTNGSAVEFSSVKVTNREDKEVLANNDFTGDDPTAEWTFVGAEKADFAVADPTTFGEETAEGKVLSVASTVAAGSMAYFGSQEWNYIQFAAKARILEESGNGFVIYFCVKDDKNYKELIVGDRGNTYVTVNDVVDGVKTKLAEKLWKVHIPAEGEAAWIPCSITFEKETIHVYVSGQSVAELYADDEVENPFYGGVGLGTWATAVSYDNLKITSNETGIVLYQNNFSNASSISKDFIAGQYGHDGSWATMDDWLSEWVVEDDDVEHGKVLKMTNSTPTGGAIMITESLANEEWQNITIELDARIDGGNEGWLVVFGAIDETDCTFWNVGGWGNSNTCFQYVKNNSKSGQQSPLDSKYNVGEWYHLTLVINGDVVDGYINGYFVHSYTKAA